MISFSFYDIFRRVLNNTDKHDRINKDEASLVLSQFLVNHCVAVDIVSEQHPTKPVGSLWNLPPITDKFYPSYGVRVEVRLLLHPDQLNKFSPPQPQEKTYEPAEVDEEPKEEVSRFHKFLDGDISVI